MGEGADALHQMILILFDVARMLRGLVGDGDDDGQQVFGAVRSSSVMKRICSSRRLCSLMSIWVPIQR